MHASSSACVFILQVGKSRMSRSVELLSSAAKSSIRLTFATRALELIDAGGWFRLHLGVFAELLPCFVIHGKPVSGYLAVQVPVSNGCALQLRLEGLDTAVRHVVLHRRVDETAALAGFGHPVDGLDGGFGAEQC